MKRVFNFSAGPAVLPEEVLKEAANEMLNYKGIGMSVMEMSHRSKEFEEILESAKSDLSDLLKISSDYEIVFIQGGASSVFSMVPLNFSENKISDYILTGQWAQKAYDEATRYTKANIIASSKDENYSYIPDCTNLTVTKNADYVYICENNTIYGTKFKTLPDTKGKPLIADLSSCILSEPMDVEKYAMFFAGAQKNIGPAGVTLAVINKELLKRTPLAETPTMMRFSTHVKANSLYNTPPTYGIYLCGKVFKWLKKEGGLSVMKEKNERKASLLYDYLDESTLFKGTVKREDRSLMNAPFITGTKELDEKFIQEAKEAGLVNLKGHRSVGGMRASIYNAMPLEGVETLVEFMKKFERENR
ncbi:MAG TPA: 3-phosphoserine/phosphohydroxythreonine transaminase [Candidatus Dorea intestinavium]|nr:3-phosphoserine/phosphohydroxythreonine transaminase [Candidatus Dorea intestinavium]